MPTSALATLERIQDRYDGPSAVRKLALLRTLAGTRLRSAREVERLHEALCFLRAYPDDARVAAQVERLLRRFGSRTDLRRHRAALAGSGIAGTTIRYAFFWPTARWLAQRWPGSFRLDRDDTEAGDNIAGALPLLVTPAEAAWLRARRPGGFAALDALRGRASDAAWLVRAIEARPGDSFNHEALFDRLDPLCELHPGRATPSRTLDRDRVAPAVFRRQPLRRSRPDLRAEIDRSPRAVQALSAAAGGRLVELARAAMVTRQRDLDAFAYGDARDVRRVDDGAGLAFALIGMQPERRTLLPAVYGILTLQNGVPIGYSQADVLAGTAAISFNVFPTFRGGETALGFARLLAAVRQVLGASSFSIEPYQLGHGNDEAIDSGAWWFYYKLGFRPRTAPVRRIVRAELARMQADPHHRSAPATLRALAGAHLHFELDPARPRALPPLAALGERTAALLHRLGGDRDAALETASREMLRLTGLGSMRGFTAAERTAWRRWSPALLALPGISRWSRGERRAVAAVLRAKGGRRESEFALRFDAHPRLVRALYALG